MDKKLLDITSHAYQTVPFYQELAKVNGINIENIKTIDDFEKLPFIDKSMMQNTSLSTLSEPYNHYPYNSQMLIRRTSGSTGQFLKVYWHEADDRNSLLELWWIRKKYYGVSPNDRLCYFYTTDYINNKLVDEKDEKESLLKKELGFNKKSLNTDELKEIYMKIYEYDPVWMLLQPSTALLLAECILAYELPKLRSLKYIEFSGEILFESYKEILDEAFGCKINNQYGCVETNSIATYMGGSELICHGSNVYVEVFENGVKTRDGEEGDIYVTSLTNHAMPFIRYKTGDRGRLFNNIDKETNATLQKLELTNGRISDFVVVEENEKIPAYVFVRSIEHVSEEIGPVINQFQVIQNNINNFTVKLAIKPAYKGWKDTIQELFIKYVNQPLLKNAEYEFEFSTHLFPQETTGKLAFFYNKMS